MYLDFAPMEGITGAVFRRLHHRYFPGVDRYYAPFLSPTSDHRFTPKDLREILPENNAGIELVPQLLTKNAEDFLWAAGELKTMGYREINLNVGCPSGTVTAKGKGSGMLADPQALDRFLDAVYSKAPCAISVKTRLGMEDPGEFDAILEIYNRYPMSELIIHPRVRKDFYRHPVRGEVFDRAQRNTSHAVGYNGSIVTVQDHAECVRQYPKLRSVMIGQGLVSDPFLAGRIRHGHKSDLQTLVRFHEELLDTYSSLFGDRNNAVKRMKELWFYLIKLFADGEKHGKKILKAKNAQEYALAVSAVFRELELLYHSTGGW